MALNVVKFEGNIYNGTVVLEAPRMEELDSMVARELVLKTAAQHGMVRPGTVGMPSIYPVDDKGEASDDVFMGKKPVAAYRADYMVGGAV